MNYTQFQTLENKILLTIIPYFRTESLNPQSRRMQLKTMVTLIHRNAKSYSKIDILKELLNTTELIKENKEEKDIQLLLQRSLKVNTRQLENAIRHAEHDYKQHVESNPRSLTDRG